MHTRRKSTMRSNLVRENAFYPWLWCLLGWMRKIDGNGGDRISTLHYTLIEINDTTSWELLPDMCTDLCVVLHRYIHVCLSNAGKLIIISDLGYFIWNHKHHHNKLDISDTIIFSYIISMIIDLSVVEWTFVLWHVYGGALGQPILEQEEIASEIIVICSLNLTLTWILAQDNVGVLMYALLITSFTKCYAFLWVNEPHQCLWQPFMFRHCS
jgi:hypothetical protein